MGTTAAAASVTAPQLITSPAQLTSLLTRCAAAPRIALDLEANGLHVYRAQLCVIQLAWETPEGVQVAVVDPFEVDISSMAALLGEDGPLKLLHDMTFDAMLLAEHNVRLGHVEDTSVAARFLGETATGLASLSSKLLDVHRSKKLQSHNWARRPFSRAQLDYLAGDVLHLFALRDALYARIDESDINEEVRLECTYKLTSALAPKAASAPPYQRMKGYRTLSDERRAAARRLHAERDALAQRRDVPPHHIASNQLLIDLASANHSDAASLRRRFRSQRSFRRYAEDWLRALRQALAGDAPPEPEEPTPARFSRNQVQARKKLDTALSRWRKKEAARRGVDRQVVIPGHCMGPVASVLLDGISEDALAAVLGFGEFRVRRYAAALAALVAPASVEAASIEAARPPEPAPPE